MSRDTLFISDLHLDQERPATTGLFLEFLKTTASRADALYILGDLFEAWVGDDDLTEHNLSVINALKELVDSGIPVFLMHGNRDFLMATGFEQQSGSKLLTDPCIVDLYGEKVLLSHGDILCTDDREYINFRNSIRNEEWTSDFLSKPLAERKQIAAGLRAQSMESNSHKPEAIMDVNQKAVEAAMSGAGVNKLIHGHTHRPAIHEFTLNNETMQRLVLGDWHEQGSVLRCNSEGYTLETV